MPRQGSDCDSSQPTRGAERSRRHQLHQAAGTSHAHKAQSLAPIARSPVLVFADVVAVAGTHGKTTTTAMLSLILRDSGDDVTVRWPSRGAARAAGHRLTPGQLAELAPLSFVERWKKTGKTLLMGPSEPPHTDPGRLSRPLRLPAQALVGGLVPQFPGSQNPGAGNVVIGSSRRFVLEVRQTPRSPPPPLPRTAHDAHTLRASAFAQRRTSSSRPVCARPLRPSPSPSPEPALLE